VSVCAKAGTNPQEAKEKQREPSARQNPSKESKTEPYQMRQGKNLAAQNIENPVIGIKD
jgi:hypothetical protein